MVDENTIKRLAERNSEEELWEQIDFVEDRIRSVIKSINCLEQRLVILKEDQLKYHDRLTELYKAKQIVLKKSS